MIEFVWLSLGRERRGVRSASLNTSLRDISSRNDCPGMRIVTVSDAPGKLVWLRRRTRPCCVAVWKRSARTSGSASHQAASAASEAKVGTSFGLVRFILPRGFLVVGCHGVNEMHLTVTYGEDKCVSPRGGGFAQVQIAQFTAYELFFDYQWIIPIALFGFVRGEPWRATWRMFSSSQLKTVRL